MKTNIPWLAPVFLAALGFTPLSAQSQFQYPFQNPDLPIEERVNNIISLMTPDEKISLLSQSPGVPRLGIRSMQQTEGLHGVKAGGQRHHHLPAIHRPGGDMGCRGPSSSRRDRRV